MVLAFTLFIGATGFAIFLLRASLTQQEVEIQSDILLERIMQHLSVTVTKQLFVLNTTIEQPYYTLALSDTALPLRVVSVQGIPLSASQRETTLTVARGEGTSIYILSSIGLVPLPSTPLLPAQPGTGTFGAPREETLLSQQAIETLAHTYGASYPLVQQTLALPPGITFTFRVMNETGVIGEGVQQPPRGVSVQSSTQRRAFLYTDGRETFVNVEVRVW